MLEAERTLPRTYDFACTITGAAGFVGGQLARALMQQEQYRVRVFGVDLAPSDLTHGLETAIDNGNRFTFHEYDVHQPLRSDFLAVDAVYHFAGIADPKRYLEETIEVLNLNLLGLINILERIVVWSAHRPRIIYSSTSEVYGKNPHVPFHEDESDLVFGPVKNTRWCYAMSKAVAEHYLAAYSARYDVRHTVFRFFNFVGPGIDKPGAGRVLTKMTGDAIEQGTIYVSAPGGQTRCFTHSRDFVVPLMGAMFMKKTDPDLWKRDFTMNLGSTIELSMVDVAEIVQSEVLKRTGKRPEIRWIAGVDLFGHGYEDVERRVPDTSRARKVFGWEAKEDPMQFIPELVQLIMDELGVAP